MPFLTARAKLTYGSGKVTTRDSASLNVNKSIPLNEWMIRVEWCPVGSTVITNRANYEIAEPIRIPHNAYVNVYPILRSEKDLTQTEYGLHLASFRFDDALINGRSVKTIATNEIVGTWKFAPHNVLNIVSLYTDAEPYGSSALNVIFKQFYGSDIACTIVREGVLISNEDVTLFYSEQDMQGGNWTRYDAGYNSIDGNIVFNGKSYPDNSTLWTVDNLLLIPGSSPMRSVFDIYSKVEIKFLVSTGQTVTINYNYYTVFDGTRQYRNDQYPNLNGFENKIKPYTGRTAKMSVRLFN